MYIASYHIPQNFGARKMSLTAAQEHFGRKILADRLLCTTNQLRRIKIVHK